MLAATPVKLMTVQMQLSYSAACLENQSYSSVLHVYGEHLTDSLKMLFQTPGTTKQVQIKIHF